MELCPIVSTLTPRDYLTNITDEEATFHDHEDGQDGNDTHHVVTTGPLFQRLCLWWEDKIKTRCKRNGT
jgi:hypothetical protein